MSLEAKTRIMVTGLGAVTPLGNSVGEFWQNLIEGKCGIGRISGIGLRNEVIEKINTDVDIAAQVKGFDAKTVISAKELLRFHRVTEFATVASLEALITAGFIENGTNFLKAGKLSLDSINSKRFGIRMGTGVGGGTEIAEIEDTIIKSGDSKISSRSMLRLLSERTATVPSRLFNIKGPTAGVFAACASSAIAIGDAVDKMLLGKADVMLAGGSEAAIHRVSIGAFNAMRALSRDNENPATASRPFNKNAGGFVMGEGAGVLVLETLNHVLKRGGENRIIAEILGHADTADADDDVQPNGEGAIRAMMLALSDARVKVSQLDYINTHGTATVIGDWVEIKAILKLLGKYVSKVSVSSTKGATGHLLGAAGAIEAIISCKAIQEQIAPPTLNLTDPIVEGLDLVPLAKRRSIRKVLSNSFAFGGICASLVFGEYLKE